MGCALFVFPISEFPTNRTELNAVFDIFDRNNTGYIEYKEFVEALRPEKHVSKHAAIKLKQQYFDSCSGNSLPKCVSCQSSFCLMAWIHCEKS